MNECKIGEVGIDNLLRDGKDVELLPVVLSLCCCKERLSSSRSTAVKSCRGLIVVLWVSVEDVVGDSEEDRKWKRWQRFLCAQRMCG